MPKDECNGKPVRWLLSGSSVTIAILPCFPQKCLCNRCWLGLIWGGKLAPASFYRNQYSAAGSYSVLPTLGVREVQDMGRADWRHCSEKTQRTQGGGCIFLPSLFWRNQRQSKPQKVVMQITLLTLEEIWIKGHSPLVVGYICVREKILHVKTSQSWYCIAPPDSQAMDTQSNMKYIYYWHVSITVPFLVLWLIQDLTKK